MEFDVGFEGQKDRLRRSHFSWSFLIILNDQSSGLYSRGGTDLGASGVLWQASWWVTSMHLLVCLWKNEVGDVEGDIDLLVKDVDK